MKSRKYLLPVLLLTALLCAPPAQAQDGEPTLSFRLNKIFGYALGSDIQGSFNVSVQDEGLTEITLYIDGQQVEVDDQAPFRIQFSTSDFSAGDHSIQVRGSTTEGEEVVSQTVVVNFLSTEQARTQTVDFVVPLLAVILAIMVLSSVLPALWGRRKRAFQPGDYGPAGGTVCARCKLPFSRNLFSANLLVGKLERCPHCGKWGLVRRASSADLEAAETRYAATLSDGVIQQEDEQAHLRRMVDESRYEGNE
jgi:hypothetical protein